jgi:hypothetical protein
LKPEHTDDPLIEECRAHREMTEVCIIYLGLRCFHPDATDEQINLAVINGDLRLHDYVLSSWLYHLMKAYNWKTEVLPEQLDNAVFQLMKTFFRSNCWRFANNLSATERHEAIKAGMSLLLKYRRDALLKPRTNQGYFSLGLKHYDGGP